MSKTPAEFINKVVERWKPRLLLHRWAIVVEMAGEDKPSCGDITVATMGVNHRYAEGKLTVFPALLQKPATYQKATIVHELAHIATEPIREALRLAVNRGVISDKRREDLVEDITEYIARILIVAYSRNHKQKDYHI